MIIIGITGTIGAGKGTVVDYLLAQHQFTHYSVRSFLIKEANRRGLPLNRDTYVAVANDLRKNHSPSYIIDQLYIQAAENGHNAIIESIRTPGEVESLRNNKNFYLFAVDADPKIRYQRIGVRNSETDQISYETFIANEEREMQSTSPNQQNLSECMKRADFRIHNNGTIEDLQKQVEQIIQNL